MLKYKNNFLSKLWLVLPLLFLIHKGLAQEQKNWVEKYETELYTEGRYARNVSGPVFELISIYSYIEPFVWNKNQKLYIDFEAPDSSNYTIIGQEKRIDKYYWFQSKNRKSQTGNNLFGPWEVDKTISSLKIKPAQLALLLQIKNDSLFEQSTYINAYLPVGVYHKCLPDTLEEYNIVSRVYRHFKKGSYIIAEGIQEGRINPNHHLLKEGIGTYYPGQILELSVPIDKLDRSDKNWFTINVSLIEAGNLEKHNFRFYIYHP